MRPANSNLLLRPQSSFMIFLAVYVCACVMSGLIDVLCLCLGIWRKNPSHQLQVTKL